MDNIVLEFEDALLLLDRIKIKDILIKEFEKDENFIRTLERIIVPSMENIGSKWESGEIALSQIYMSGKICEEIVDEMIPKTEAKRIDDPNLALVVFQDHHILGKMMVYTFLRASGYDVIDYGCQNDIDVIIEKLKKDNIKILMISVLMLNSALHIEKLTSKIKEEKLDIKVVVGGAPFRFDTELFNEINADAMATNASQVIDIIKDLKETL